MTSAWLHGQRTQLQRQKVYVCRSGEQHRTEKRHSNFWIGLYGFNWIVAWHECQVWVKELVSSIRMGAGILSARSKGYEAYTASTLARLSPLEGKQFTFAIHICTSGVCMN